MCVVVECEVDEIQRIPEPLQTLKSPEVHPLVTLCYSIPILLFVIKTCVFENSSSFGEAQEAP